ncbi:hypothetical protein SAMN04487905_108163 [Actinopolyspora xinjiangensis]|uniref:Putative membrane protein insertion efficiency factor n=1 Tax=Actinopolyspora xinjiangensis TaxID=405564 RepID=A0A1H0VBJ1_9ACTN|nr:hypothetical protein SAMN04487905_108163 [Actinopolyspora xinjiangensis]
MAEQDSGSPEDSAAVPTTRPGPVAWLLSLPVHAYRRVISPLLPPTCRFYPSCSAYAVEALRVHGAIRGGWLAVWRLLRCGPWHPGGIDPVPPRKAPKQRDARRAAERSTGEE